MWPWEHVLVGYLAYSLVCHLVYRDSPDGLETVAVVLGALLPDLIDKPLAWEFGVFESGYAMGHSIFFALPFTLVVGLLASAVGRVRAGIALAAGYTLHLPGDVLYGFVNDGVVYVGVLLWPLGHTPGSAEPPGFREQVGYYLSEYREEVAAGDLSVYVLLQLGLVGLVGVLWLADGVPVLREGLRGGRRLGAKFVAAITDSGTSKGQK